MQRCRVPERLRRIGVGRTRLCRRRKTRLAAARPRWHCGTRVATTAAARRRPADVPGNTWRTRIWTATRTARRRTPNGQTCRRWSRLRRRAVSLERQSDEVGAESANTITRYLLPVNRCRCITRIAQLQYSSLLSRAIHTIVMYSYTYSDAYTKKHLGEGSVGFTTYVSYLVKYV